MRTFKRPMFRKGGTTGGGIMDNVVERGQYAEGPNDPSKKLDSVTSGLDFIEQVGGSDKGLGDPLTQFLLQLGPRIATQTGGGGIIPNILGAAKEPVQNLIQSQRAKKKTKQAIALELYKNLSDSDKIALQEKIEYLMSPEGGGFDKEEAFNRALPGVRKDKSQAQIDRESLLSSIDDIVEVTKFRGDQQLTKGQAKRIYNNEQRLKKSNPKIYEEFDMFSGGDKYILDNREEYEGDINSETGATLIDNSNMLTYPENTYFYDVGSGNFIYRQGKRVFKVDLDIQEG
tara:strand:+ start:658 stop:1518 length:861 start_codon:yes stop_codon:yes gene_type:complete